MKIKGYTLRGYDAAFDKTCFLISEHDVSVEIEDLNTGIRFIIPKEELNDKRKRAGHKQHKRLKKGEK